MDPRLHIIVTSEEGRARTFVVSKTFLKRLASTLAVVFVVSSIAGIVFSVENLGLKLKIGSLKENVSTLSIENQDLHSKVTSLEEKNKAQLTGAYGELNQRSQLIDSILSTLNISSAPIAAENKDGKNSGGPFTSITDDSCDDLILKVDQDIKTIRPIPLGYPVVANRVSSTFGRRVDPMNGRIAFHDGIDLSGQRGSEVKVTADGKVVERGYNSSYGRYVIVDHGNNFTTMYAHNSKILIPWGAEVKRGDVISLLGNTGRSTGPHLHYEIRYKNKPINPIKYLNITKLLSLDQLGTS